MKISVIIPVYNVKPYAEACLRSIMGQSFHDLEILVIDDGSTDGSGEICDRISKEDERIHVFHQKNEGLSAARNAGLRAARGDYVAPVDSDDLLAPDYMKKLLDACVDNNAAVSVCDHRSFTEDSEVEQILWQERFPVKGEKSAVHIFSSVQCLENMYHPISSGMSFTAWGKLYQRSLFNKLKLEYPIGKIHEDQFVTYRLIDTAGVIAYVPQELYCYRLRNDSIMHKTFNRKRLDLMEATREQCFYFLDREEKNIAALAVNNHIRTDFSLLACARESDSEEGRELETKIKKVLKEDCHRFLPVAAIPEFKKWIYYLASELPTDFIIQKLRMF